MGTTAMTTASKSHRIWGRVDRDFDISEHKSIFGLLDNQIEWCESCSEGNVSDKSSTYDEDFRDDDADEQIQLHGENPLQVLTDYKVCSVMPVTEKYPKPRPKGELRLAVHIHINMEAPTFNPVGFLIGKGGCNMKRIVQNTGAHLRVRGKGSGYLEVKGLHEAQTPLMIAVTGSAADPQSFKRAVSMTLEQLSFVEARFTDFCRKQGFRTRGPHFHISFLSLGAAELLSGQQ